MLVLLFVVWCGCPLQSLSEPNYPYILQSDNPEKVATSLLLNTIIHVLSFFLVISDIDECSLNITSCINSDCFNENGSFTCGDCYPGFMRVGNQSTAPCREYINFDTSLPLQ